MDWKRILLYIIGMGVLAVGLTLNTKTTLGVSPIISVANCFSEIYGIKFGDATLAWYSIFIVAEIILHMIMGGSQRNRRILSDVLQFPVSLIFTRFLNFLAEAIPTFETDCAGTFAATIPGRILLLLFGLLLTGIGAALSLDMRIVPNPGDGIVQTIADFRHQRVGNMKNIVDICCVILTCALSLLLAGRIIGIGIGTILAALLVGRVIYCFNSLFLEKLQP